MLSIFLDVELSSLSEITADTIKQSSGTVGFNPVDLTNEQIKTLIIDRIQTKMTENRLKIIQIKTNVNRHLDCIFVKQDKFDRILEQELPNILAHRNHNSEGQADGQPDEQTNEQILTTMIANNLNNFPSLPMFYLLIQYSRKHLDVSYLNLSHNFNL